MNLPFILYVIGVIDFCFSFALLSTRRSNRKNIASRSEELEKKEQQFQSEKASFEEHVRQEKEYINVSLQSNSNLRKELQESRKQLEADRLSFISEKAAFHEWQRNIIIDIDSLNLSNSERSKTLDALQANLDARAKKAAICEKLINDTRQDSPWLAEKFADIDYISERKFSYFLESKSRPASTAAEKVRSLSSEKRTLTAQLKQLQYQLCFYETMFPWLEDFKEVPVQEAVSHVNFTSQNEDYDSVRNWLSPDEYSRLENTHKFQLALDRWKNRNKSSWEIGIEFERYIGYQLECKGYKVKYFGALMGFEDMGRDLLATKDGVTLVIQCKRWAKEKTIHEKHICQLYGSVAVLSIQNPRNKYKGVFITTTSLSDVARSFASYSKISVVEQCAVGDYPVIKCNISKNGDKIYHLPFDQQYDRVEITPSKGERYVFTVQEAEDLGFRRAFRWRPS